MWGYIVFEVLFYFVLDLIFGLLVVFCEDINLNKIDLGVGVYKDE